MSLSLALNTALTSLNVNQRSLSVLSQNIANANNQEYSRQIISQEAVYLQGTGSGVRIREVGRKVDEYLQNSVRTQQASYGRAETIASYTERLQVLLGKPGSNNSVYSYATSFFNALQSVAQTPENASLRVNAVNLAKQTAREMSTLANGIYDMQFSVDQDIKRSIDVVNTASREIYELNAAISANKLLGRGVSELEDRRDTELAKISAIMDVQTYTQSNGVLSVFTAGGNSIVDENLYEITYNASTSVDFFSNGNSTNAIQIYRLNESGQRTGAPSTIVTAGKGDTVTSAIASGKLKGLLELRDHQLPDVLEKLDMLAATMRDEMNAIHNAGVAYPGANSYTGTRAMAADEYSQWTGQVRIAVLGSDGKPVPANYTDEENGLRPLVIDFDSLNTGQGDGYASLQGIINEINNYYGVPQNKVELGPLNDIRLVLNNDSLPGATPQLDFDFQLDNISGTDADFFVADIQVLNSTGVDITNITQNVPTIALASTGTYTTTEDSQTVTVATAGSHGLVEGDIVYLEVPPSSAGGINAAQLGGYFTIRNVTSSGFDITAALPASASVTSDQAGVSVRPAYDTAVSGTNERTKENGTIIASLAGNSTSPYYTVNATVGVKNADGTISQSVVTYRIDNLGSNTRNYRYAASAATSDGKIVPPNTATPAMRAIMVDANGNELPISNNAYSTSEVGYLKLVSDNTSYVIAIDSLNSAEQGKPNAVPKVEGSERGFAHYFELNNLFVSNRTTGVTDQTEGSARNMAVSTALVKNANLLSIGRLSESPSPVDPSKPPPYTYERTFGDNSIIDQLSALATKTVSFGAAGDLGANSQTLTAYAGQIISTVSTRAGTNQSDMENASLLLEGFSERSDAVRGVNLDEELANTVIYQNAYAASARVITVANQFFDELMSILRT